ncbi:helix-turn-helix transcriptional regulator [Streptomyces actinomycinicus]|uniref:Helix-turn-helix transcriptional regulator n=1 Tax=Streptomyces actinomycinicus TaxID=1695166 RepID=A0A937JJS9_9ACTN|nr:helix-turn-helix transcriptional regulator [Streptomyces actinomycinicus]MBL1081759.1 helix-turn-helix transcriptional regulator [Streptomyces actinomycinicus]
MVPVDPLWNSKQALELAAQRRPGALIRLGRRHHSWTLAALGDRLGCSPATVSRMERRIRIVDLALVHRAALEVGMPRHILVTSLAPPAPSAPMATRVTASPCDAEEDPMRRRTLLTATVAAGPVALLAGLDEALAYTPVPAGAGPLDGRLAAARTLYDRGAHGRLLAELPGLIADAHSAARAHHTLGQARLSTVYSLASSVLIKLGSYDRARLTADRARTWAEVSGSPLVAAAATRELAIVLRHQDRNDAAQRLMSAATTDLEATGLRTDAVTAAYAQLLCTLAYTAARGGRRAEALAMTEEARRAARQLPHAAPPGRLFAVTPATVDLYAVGVHWALGDAGAALEAGKNLRPEQFPTAERRARMSTDMARAWWAWQRPEQTAQALLVAYRSSPGEVRDRPAIRGIVDELAERHPRVSGVRELRAAVTRAGAAPR